MRSLYTADIQGTSSKPTIFDKSYFKNQHDQIVKRSPFNPQGVKYQWFVPLPKAQKHTPQPNPCLNTVKLISEHTGLAMSMHYQNTRKNNNVDLSQSHNYSRLSNNGHSIVGKTTPKVNQGNNPYYPHRIRQAGDNSQSTRFTGNRSWNYSPSPKVNLPDSKSQYISKWIRL